MTMNEEALRPDCTELNRLLEEECAAGVSISDRLHNPEEHYKYANPIPDEHLYKSTAANRNQMTIHPELQAGNEIIREEDEEEFIRRDEKRYIPPAGEK